MLRASGPRAPEAQNPPQDRPSHWLATSVRKAEDDKNISLIIIDLPPNSPSKLQGAFLRPSRLPDTNEVVLDTAGCYRPRAWRGSSTVRAIGRGLGPNEFKSSRTETGGVRIARHSSKLTLAHSPQLLLQLVVLIVILVLILSGVPVQAAPVCVVVRWKALLSNNWRRGAHARHADAVRASVAEC